MENTLNNRLYFWGFYEYGASPMCFVKLLEDGAKLPNDVVVDLLYLFDGWYGNTDQETTDWALEYQLLARMLLNDGALLVNPKYLDLDFESGTRVPGDLADILKSVSLQAYHLYEEARTLTQEEINRLHAEEEGAEEPVQQYRRVMITRCGYAVVPGNTDEEALDAVKELTEKDFNWERVDQGVLENADVIEVCGPNGEV